MTRVCAARCAAQTARRPSRRARARGHSPRARRLRGQAAQPTQVASFARHPPRGRGGRGRKSPPARRDRGAVAATSKGKFAMQISLYSYTATGMSPSFSRATRGKEPARRTAIPQRAKHFPQITVNAPLNITSRASSSDTARCTTSRTWRPPRGFRPRRPARRRLHPQVRGRLYSPRS